MSSLGTGFRAAASRGTMLIGMRSAERRTRWSRAFMGNTLPALAVALVGVTGTLLAPVL